MSGLRGYSRVIYDFQTPIIHVNSRKEQQSHTRHPKHPSDTLP